MVVLVQCVDCTQRSPTAKKHFQNPLMPSTLPEIARTQQHRTCRSIVTQQPSKQLLPSVAAPAASVLAAFPAAPAASAVASFPAALPAALSLQPGPLVFSFPPTSPMPTHLSTKHKLLTKEKHIPMRSAWGSIATPAYIEITNEQNKKYICIFVCIHRGHHISCTYRC